MAINTTSTNNKDTWIDEETPSATHGSDTQMLVTESYNTERYSLISFTLPSDLGTISKISLKLYDTGNGNPRVLECYQSANTTWSEATANWTSDNGNISGSVIHSATCPSSAEWMTWDIRGGSATNPLTSLTWGNTVSFTLKTATLGNAGWLGGQFYTKEYTTDTTKQPYLEITYESTFNPSIARRRLLLANM